MDWTLTTKLFLALFAIMNPLTVIPVYLALTTDGDSNGKGRSTIIALVLTVTLGTVLIAFAGHLILDAFGITLPYFSLAGGLIVLQIALTMLNGKEHSSHHGTEQEQEQVDSDANPGIYPLGIPLALGPGTIATILIFAQDAKNGSHLVNYYIGLAAYVVFFAVVMAGAPWIGKRLSPASLSVIKRIMGIILAAIAVEMMGNALGKIFPAWLA